MPAERGRDTQGRPYQYPHYTFRIISTPTSFGRAPSILLQAADEPDGHFYSVWNMNKDHFKFLMDACQAYAFQQSTGREHQT